MKFSLRSFVALGGLLVGPSFHALGQTAAAAFAYKIEAYAQEPGGAPTLTSLFFSGGFQLAQPRVITGAFHPFITTSGLSMAHLRLSDDGLVLSGNSLSYSTRAALNTDLPNGRIGFSFSGPSAFEGSLELAGDRYPSAPWLTNLAALQAVPGNTATVEWQLAPDALASDEIAVTISALGGELLFSTGSDPSRGTDGRMTRAIVQLPPGREAIGTVTVLRSAARDALAGVELQTGYTTSTAFRLRSTGIPDATPPRVVTTTPGTNAVGVNPTARVQITFDETMRPRGMLSGISLEPGTRQRVTWSDDQKTASFDFPQPLPAGPVELTFSNEVNGLQSFQDISGIPLPAGTVAASFFVGNLPVFTRQPESATPALNSTTTLTATAAWPPGGLTYQWFRDGVAVPGASTATLTIPNFDLGRSGLYEVRATNANGATLSSPALVMIDAYENLPRANIHSSMEAPAPYQAEPITPGLPLTLSLRVAGPVSSVYWRKNGERITGATAMSLDFASLAESDTGIYDAVLTNAYGSNASDPFVLVVRAGRAMPTYTITRESDSVIRGRVAVLHTNVQIPFGFQRGWQFNGQWISQGGTETSLFVPNIQPKDAGVYRFYVSNGIESVLVAEYTISVRDSTPGAPVITQQPRDMWFSEDAGDTTGPIVEGAIPLKYQWKRNGVEVPGDTSSILPVSVNPPGREGTYTCVISNAFGSVETRPITVRFISARAAPEKPNISNGFKGVRSQAFSPGGTLDLQSGVESTVPQTTGREWRRNGVAIPYQNSSSLRIHDLTTGHSGTYTVVYSNSYGATESDPFTVRVVSPDEAPFQARSKETVRAQVGELLQLHSPFTWVGNLRTRWFLNGREVTGENARDGSTSSFTILSVQPEHAGTWIAEASNPSGTASATAAEVIIEPGPPASVRLINVSTRATAGQGSATLIVGFGLSGSEPKRLLLRAVGPALGQFGVNNAARNPRLAVFRGTQLIASNDDWYRQQGVAALATAQRQAGAYSLDLKEGDAALVATLEPGSYTLQYLTHEPGGEALGLIEAYDLDAGYPPTRLTNLSSRLFVGTGEQTAIPGLVVKGTGTKTYLVRAIGPGLAKFGVSDLLADPRIVLTGGGGVSFSNDDWETTNPSAIRVASERVGAFALDAGSKDAALLVALPAGNYTAHISGANHTTGVALVELYEVP